MLDDILDCSRTGGHLLRLLAEFQRDGRQGIIVSSHSALDFMMSKTAAIYHAFSFHINNIVMVFRDDHFVRALELLTVFIKQTLRFRGADMRESVTKNAVINAHKRSSNFITQEVQNDV